MDEQQQLDPEDAILNEHYERLEQKEFDQWELSGYWNALKELGNSLDYPNPKQQKC